MPVQNAHTTGTHTTRTVKDFIANPTLIKQSLTLLAQNEFIAESLFQGGYNAEGGAIAFHTSNNPFTNEMADANENFAVAEGQEAHQVYQSDVGPQTARVQKYFIEGWVTYEEEEYNQLGALARLNTRMKNTMVAKLDGAVFNMLATNGSIRNYAPAGGADWLSPTYPNLYDDVLVVKGMINRRSLNGGNTYRANTVVFNEGDYYEVMRNQGLKDYYKETDQAAQAPAYTGTMGTLAGLNVMVSPYAPQGYAFILERGTIGGIADAKPLTVKPIERDESRERYFIRMVRRTVAFLTDANAIVRIPVTV